MSIEAVRAHLERFGLASRVMEKPQSSATVELAAQAVGVTAARIVKTLSFSLGGGCLLVCAAGDAKIDNAKYRRHFSAKARMLPPEEVREQTGHAVGGVCPFALPGSVRVAVDISVRRFTSVFPACGSGNSMIELTPDELYQTSGATEWVDVCKDWQPPI